MTIKPVCLAAFILAVTAIAALAHGGSIEDQIACTPDVYRLCSQFVPDEDAIVACLQRRKSELSADCHAVFSRPEHKGSSDSSDD